MIGYLELVEVIVIFNGISYSIEDDILVWNLLVENCKYENEVWACIDFIRDIF